MATPRVVVDTNVLVAGLRSRQGASFALLSEIGGKRFELALSVPLFVEYEATLSRMINKGQYTRADIDLVLDYLCSVAHLQEIFYLWRPQLRDPQDDLVLEVAVAANCEAIITYNRKDFAGAEAFGIRILTPAEFLRKIGLLL